MLPPPLWQCPRASVAEELIPETEGAGSLLEPHRVVGNRFCVTAVFLMHFP